MGTSQTVKTTPGSSNYGWTCPRCGTVWAPWISSCGHCHGNWYGDWGPWWNDYWKITCADSSGAVPLDIKYNVKTGDPIPNPNDYMAQCMAKQSAQMEAFNCKN